MELDTYAEVVDAIHTQSTDKDSIREKAVSIMEKAENTVVVQSEESEDKMKQEGKLMKSLVFPLSLQRPSLGKARMNSVSAKNDLVICTEDSIPNQSNDHLYDSVDTLCSPNTMCPAFKPAFQESPDGPHVYHVLEKPVTPGSPKLTTFQPPLPQNPPPNRQRKMSCVSLNPTIMDSTMNSRSPSFPSLLTSGGTQKSVNDKLISVITIYEEVQAVSTSVLVPPRPEKLAKKDDVTQKDKDHVYHTVENMPSRVLPTPGEQQITEQTVTESNSSIFQTFKIENVEESAVYKTKEVCFQSLLPKGSNGEKTKSSKHVQPFSRNSPADNETKHNHTKYTDSFSQKPSTEDPEYARPFTSGWNCKLFDDPAYCTHSCTVRKSDREVNSNSDEPLFDEPSYANPSVSCKGRKDHLDQSTESLFDDPKYNLTGIRLDSPRMTRSLRVKFDDPKYQSTSIQNLFQSHQIQDESKNVQHNSSMEHFNASTYSSVPDLLDNSDVIGSSNSLTDTYTPRQ